MKVLVVDDDDGIRQMLSVCLSLEEGVGEVRVASNGRIALEECAGFAPDLVLLDYWMPEMDGATAAVILRDMHPAACIVAFSGALEGKPKWADYYVAKGDLPDLRVLIDLARAE